MNISRNFFAWNSIWSVILLLIMLTAFVISGCVKPSARGTELAVNAPSYMRIAEYANANLRKKEYSVSQDRYSVSLKDISDIDEIASDVAVAMKDYSYIWIEDCFVQFWNDETKTEGVLCAFNTTKALKELKSWYQDVRVEKIADNCYLVSPSRSWIG